MSQVFSRLTRLSASALALTLAQVGTLEAQTPTGVPGATPLSQQIGGARSNVTASVAARYDSNLARTEDPVRLAQRGLVKEDVRISPNLQLDLARPLARHQLGLQAYLGYDFYVNNTRLNRERLLIEPYAYINLPVCDLALDGSVGRRLSEIGDVVLLGLDPTVGIDNTQTTKRIVGRVICGDTFGLRPSFEIERSVGDNSNPLRQRADYRVTRYQPGLGYASPALGEISIYAVKRDTDLPNQILPNGASSGFALRGFGVSYRRAIGTRLNFNGSVSYVDVTPYSGARSRSGLNGSAALTLLANDRLQFVGFAYRAFTSTLTSNATYELWQAYGLTANYAVNDRLRFRVGGQVAPRQLFYDTIPVGPFIQKQTRTDIFAGATYNFNRRMRLTLDGGYLKRNADLDVFDYDGFFAAVGVSVSL